MRGYLPESQYDTKTREVLDDFYRRALQWCSTDPAPDNLVSLDVSKCYPSIGIDNESPMPAVVQVCLRTIVMQMRLVAIQSLLNFGVMTVYSGHPKGNICN